MYHQISFNKLLVILLLLSGAMPVFSQINGCVLPDIFAPAVVSCENVAVYNAPDPNAEKLTTLHFAVNSVTIQKDSVTTNGRKYMNVITDEGINGWIDKGCLLIRGEGAAMKCAIQPSRTNFDKDRAVTNNTFDAGELVVRVEKINDNIYVRNVSGTKKGWVTEACLMTDAENLSLAWRLYAATKTASVCDKSDNIKALKASYPGLEYTQMGEFINDAYEQTTAKCFTQKTEPVVVATASTEANTSRGLKPATPPAINKTIKKTDTKVSKEVVKPSVTLVEKPVTPKKPTQTRELSTTTTQTAKKTDAAKPQPVKETKPTPVVASKPQPKVVKPVAEKPKTDKTVAASSKTATETREMPKSEVKPTPTPKETTTPKTAIDSRQVAQRVFETDSKKSTVVKAQPTVAEPQKENKATTPKTESRGLSPKTAEPVKENTPCNVTNVTVISHTASPLVANEEIINKKAKKEVQKIYQVRNKYTETLKLVQTVEVNNAKSVAYTCYHPTLPIGTHIAIKLPKNEGFIEFVVVGKSNNKEGLGISPSMIERLFGKKPPTTVEIEYFTVEVE